jgi:hypothetical protein
MDSVTDLVKKLSYPFTSLKIAEDLTLDREPKTMAECMKCSDWSKWKVAIEDELRSLTKRGGGIYCSNTHSSAYFPRGGEMGFCSKEE